MKSACTGGWNKCLELKVWNFGRTFGPVGQRVPENVEHIVEEVYHSIKYTGKEWEKKVQQVGGCVGNVIFRVGQFCMSES